MQKQYEAPELGLVGLANEVIQGPPGLGFDGFEGFATIDFEYEPDDSPRSG